MSSKHSPLRTAVPEDIWMLAYGPGSRKLPQRPVDAEKGLRKDETAGAHITRVVIAYVLLFGLLVGLGAL